MHLPSFICFVTVTCAPFGCAPAPANESAHAPSTRERREAKVLEHDIARLRHAAEFDPSAGGRMVPCDRPEQECWESQANPTAEHARQAAQHRRQAEAERAAAGPPPTPEDIACAGVPAAARRASPLASAEVVSVEALAHGTLESPEPRLFGARLLVRSPTTPAELQRLIDCHVEHSSNVPEHSLACPLAVPGAVTTVREGENGTVVDIRVAEERSAVEVLRRAQMLETGR